MALATQCPHCLTIFRVASDQLKLRGGLVRCGSCREVFNGNEFLVEASIADGHYQPAPGSKAQAGVARPAMRAAAAPAPAPASAPAASVPRASPVASPPVLPDVRSQAAVPEVNAPAPVAAKPAAVAPAIPVIAEPKVFRSPSSPGYIPDLGASLKPAEPVDKNKWDDDDPAAPPTLATSPDEAPDSGALLRRSSAEPEDVLAPPDVAAVFRIDDEPVLHEPPLRRQEAQDEESEEKFEDSDEAEEPGFVRRAQRKARLSHMTKMVMMVLAGAMVPVLLLQSLYYWRNPLAAAVPQLRPMLNGMCVSLHCTVGLPTEIDRLSLEANELQVVPPSQNVYALTVVMRNRSSTTQAWPDIELTLNNDDEKAVVRRVFRPRDYLADPTQADNGFGPESEQQIKLNFELKDALVSGYRIYLFYP
ncbi:putative Zn finger-like uncharacterized protein [Herbaspirillum rubrisubalbicans]|uniref:DUF3426 domain-containing protein n=1 Tax=Herbaspirillum rubrisubalbicans TaxID=80842 RepID=UPI00209E7D8D|nr:DUF3426 domain-containing protein [Herbaspirillum rubrisubalbicans]MCP1575736.1 putative Zn finger-like uncharacterized protein [Herbaspirillum rubrisubalbicans]